MLDILAYGLQIIISVMFFGRINLDSLLLSSLLAAQVLLLIWKVLPVSGLRVSGLTPRLRQRHLQATRIQPLTPCLVSQHVCRAWQLSLRLAACPKEGFKLHGQLLSLGL